jgi:hypothetical protein
VDDDGRRQLNENKVATPEAAAIVERAQQPASDNSNN